MDLRLQALQLSAKVSKDIEALEEQTKRMADLVNKAVEADEAFKDAEETAWALHNKARS